MMRQMRSAPGPLVFEGPNTPAIHLSDGTAQQPFLTPTSNAAPLRNNNMLDTFSPVNENGSFEFDRVLKSKKVNRRVKPKHVSLSQRQFSALRVGRTDRLDLGI